MRCVIHDMRTGEVVGSSEVTGPSTDAAAMQQSLPDGMLCFNDDGPLPSSATHYVVDGGLVAYTPQQAAAKAQRPGPWAVWSNATFSWSDPRPLADVKAARREQINAWRDAADSGTFSFAGHVFEADAMSLARINVVAVSRLKHDALPEWFPGFWKSVDNAYVPLPDLATWDAFYAAMSAQGAANFARSEELKARLEAATTAQEVEAITWEEPS